MNVNSVDSRRVNTENVDVEIMMKLASFLGKVK